MRWSVLNYPLLQQIFWLTSIFLVVFISVQISGPNIRSDTWSQSQLINSWYLGWLCRHTSLSIMMHILVICATPYFLCLPPYISMLCHPRSSTGWFFICPPPHFSTKKKTANQPTTAAVPESPVTKNGFISSCGNDDADGDDGDDDDEVLLDTVLMRHHYRTFPSTPEANTTSLQPANYPKLPQLTEYQYQYNLKYQYKWEIFYLDKKNQRTMFRWCFALWWPMASLVLKKKIYLIKGGRTSYSFTVW